MLQILCIKLLGRLIVVACMSTIDIKVNGKQADLVVSENVVVVVARSNAQGCYHEGCNLHVIKQ